MPMPCEALINKTFPLLGHADNHELSLYPFDRFAPSHAYVRPVAAREKAPNAVTDVLTYLLTAVEHQWS